ncbi:MAG: OsmC family protein [Salibacteraceae bacterium]
MKTENASPTSTVRYLANLRTEATHTRSGTTIYTDAPTDNRGRGEAFSPTDLVATALAQCMFTIMGIAAETHQIDIKEMKADVFKTMAASPRRISKIEVRMEIYGSLSSRQREILERAALNCPVAKSLHPGIEQVVLFEYRGAD